ncbi:hypothetical protein [Devosia sp. CN2-171]|uniref:hypothetical protein n=1 Tax=Devosia sp. CN2-171 TaxID=3400909 RepID=UPI003BF82A90
MFRWIVAPGLLSLTFAASSAADEIVSIDRFCADETSHQIVFLPEATIAHTDEYALEWAAHRKLEVFLEDERVRVFITPPFEPADAAAVILVGEMSMFVSMVAHAECPIGATRTPISVSVKGIAVVQTDHGPDFAKTP